MKGLCHVTPCYPKRCLNEQADKSSDGEFRDKNVLMKPMRMNTSVDYNSRLCFNQLTAAHTMPYLCYWSWRSNWDPTWCVCVCDEAWVSGAKVWLLRAGWFSRRWQLAVVHPAHTHSDRHSLAYAKRCEKYAHALFCTDSSDIYQIPSSNRRDTSAHLYHLYEL